VLPVGSAVAGKLVDGHQLKNRSVVASKLANRSVTSRAIAANSVTTTKLAPGVVTAVKIAAGSVTAAKLAPGAVSSAKLAHGSVTADKLANGAITASKIAADAIPASKLSIDVVTVDGSAALLTVSTATASCPAGKRAFGGGITIDDTSPTSPSTALRQSAPVASAAGEPIGWVGTIANTAASGASVQYHVSAICG
jgi:hypothetical protein